MIRDIVQEEPVRGDLSLGSRSATDRVRISFVVRSIFEFDSIRSGSLPSLLRILPDLILHPSSRAFIAMKSFTIALATAKEAIRQPAFFVLAAIAGFWLIASIFVAYFTFGEDIKMYKDTGLTTISFACLLLALS